MEENPNPPGSSRKRRTQNKSKTSTGSYPPPQPELLSSRTTQSTTSTTTATTSTGSHYYSRTGERRDLSSSQVCRRGEDLGEETGDCCPDCTGQACRSCSAALVADCVAICCCPLAVVSFLALAFIRVPYVMGRRCLGKAVTTAKKKTRKKKVSPRTRSRSRSNNNNEEHDYYCRRGSFGSSGSAWRCDDFVVRRGREGKTSASRDRDRDIVFEFGSGGMKGEMDMMMMTEEVEQRISLCRGFIEVDNVLLEMYQMGHLGFGRRVSFTGEKGIQWTTCSSN